MTVDDHAGWQLSPVHYVFPLLGQDLILSAMHEPDHLDPEHKPDVTFYKDTGDGPKEIANNFNPDFYPSITPYRKALNQTDYAYDGKYNVVSNLAPQKNRALYPQRTFGHGVLQEIYYNDSFDPEIRYQTEGDIDHNGYHLIIKNAGLEDVGNYSVKYSTPTRSWEGQRTVNVEMPRKYGQPVESRPIVATIETEEPLVRKFVKRNDIWYGAWEGARQYVVSPFNPPSFIAGDPTDCNYSYNKCDNAQAWKALAYLKSLPRLVGGDDINYTVSDSGCLAVHIVSTNENMCGVDSPQELYARIPYNELTGYYEEIPRIFDVEQVDEYGTQPSGYSLNSALSGRLLPFCSQHDAPELCIKIVDECALTGASILPEHFHSVRNSVRRQWAPNGTVNEKVFCETKACDSPECKCPTPPQVGDGLGATQSDWVLALCGRKEGGVLGRCIDDFEFNECREDFNLYTLWVKVVDSNLIGWKWYKINDFSRNPDNALFRNKLSHFEREHSWYYLGEGEKKTYRITSDNADGCYKGEFPNEFILDINCSSCITEHGELISRGGGGTGSSGTGPSGTSPSGTGPISNPRRYYTGASP